MKSNCNKIEINKIIKIREEFENKYEVVFKEQFYPDDSYFMVHHDQGYYLNKKVGEAYDYYLSGALESLRGSEIFKSKVETDWNQSLDCLTIEELKSRIKLIHSWIKIYQYQVNKANEDKNVYKNELEILKDSNKRKKQ